MDVEQTSEEPGSAWSPPTITIDPAVPPKILARGIPNATDSYPDNFFRSARWCPDGLVALGQCEDRSMQILKLPESMVNSTDVQAEGRLSVFESGPVFPQPAPIVDYAWYPSASIREPSTYCFVASIRDSPVKLLDANDGRLRASYKIVDHRERFIAPHCMVFNSNSTHLYCGFEDAIEVFDIQRPGEGTRLHTTPSKKSKDGMKGIVSSLSFRPDYSGLYAASSLSSGITLYSENDGERPVGVVEGAFFPIMQVLFNPALPHLLYASQRRSDEILCWDIRSPYHVLQSFDRPATGTNQKLKFDIDYSGRWLAAGDEVGNVSFFDQQSSEPSPSLILPAHDDSVGSVTFHPYNSYLLSVSGSRNFHSAPIDVPSDGSDTESDSDSDSSSSESSDRPSETVPIKPRSLTLRRQPRRPYTTDASVKLWLLVSSSSATRGSQAFPDTSLPRTASQFQLTPDQDQNCLASG